MNNFINTYNPLEEKLNVWSHLFGVVLGLTGLFMLIMKGITNGALHTVSYSIYGASMVILFTASTLYHASQKPELRRKLKIFDHVAIYFLIAGTYTPYCLLVLKGTWGWSIFGIVWGIGIAGMILKLFYTGRFSLASTISYILMGWTVIIAIKPLIQSHSSTGLFWLGLGGFFYTTGAVFYSIKKLPFNHAIFHFFVLAGAISHFIDVYFYI